MAVTDMGLMPKIPALIGYGTAFGLGWVSAVFDNIPLTKLALEQGGHDWAMLAYAVGFGDLSYFNRCFRRRFGESPGHIRPRSGEITD